MGTGSGLAADGSHVLVTNRHPTFCQAATTFQCQQAPEARIQKHQGTDSKCTHLPDEGRVVSVIDRPRFLASRSAFTRFTVDVVTCSRMPCSSGRQRGSQGTAASQMQTPRLTCGGSRCVAIEVERMVGYLADKACCLLSCRYGKVVTP